MLVLPAGYEKGKRYKTIVHLHGGPEEAWTAGFHGSWYDWRGILASHGYVVLLPNTRGSDGAGTSFAESNTVTGELATFRTLWTGWISSYR